jgi:hypothetical protein
MGGQVPENASRGPTWQRGGADGPVGHTCYTRVYSDPTLPDLTSGMDTQAGPTNAPSPIPQAVWEANQHQSSLVRPADVAVYVVGDSRAGLKELKAHLVVQETETLHAILVVGPLCRDDSKPR